MALVLRQGTYYYMRKWIQLAARLATMRSYVAVKDMYICDDLTRCHVMRKNMHV